MASSHRACRARDDLEVWNGFTSEASQLLSALHLD
jgi:hypothetical protein